MKKYLMSLAAMALFFGACKKNTKTPDATSGNLTIQFNTVAQGKPVEYGVFKYTNEAGNLYSISLLKYFITNVVLIKDDLTEVKLNNYDLMDAFNTSAFSTVVASDVPYANYTKLKFYLGVDPTRNHTGAQDGDLDPIHNMIWTWSTGYLFLKHEGKFINSSNDTVDIQYHLGTDRALSTVEIPITLNMDKTSKKMNIQFDLNNMYNSPVINFNTDNIIHSTDVADNAWIDQMTSNTVDAFTFIDQE
jgi:hypothetical protein